MAGLLAWAADVVGAHKDDEHQDANDSIPILFTPEQQNYVQQLDRKAASLSRSIQDLRLRLPPPDIAQRLPHIHAHSLASNAALALQLNSHSATREQAQLREVMLQEENAAYEKAISSCESKIQEKIQEANSLQRKLKEMDEIEKKLVAELESKQNTLLASNQRQLVESAEESKKADESGEDREVQKSSFMKKLEDKKKELSSMEEVVQELEKKWVQVQHDALKQPSPAQREKMLDKQLHSLIAQLAVKQAQAEGLVGEIHLKEMELERLNGLWRRTESSNSEARNRFGKSNSGKGSSSADFIGDAYNKLPYYTGGLSESQQKLMLLRSAFVLYILVLHIAVFIKISF
ncbi:kinesin-like protein KIF15 [Mangifera indica]|uniref:kinesin-like protein KIF15 n=1 Tax=Mangifera indica TaxID=29780 RepID=UPI001CF934DA|nr:kinesin-like protein KIF15 [Mangifera indica]